MSSRATRASESRASLSLLITRLLIIPDWYYCVSSTLGRADEQVDRQDAYKYTRYVADEQVDRQERRKRRTRHAIQTAALELFAERGYRETTINDIAEQADVAPRTVTLHFPAKEELLFDAEPFTLASLSERLAAASAG